MEFTELSPDLLAQAQSQGTTGAYKSVLVDFANADVTSADVTSAFPNRKPSTVAAGLKNAARKDNAFDGIRVVTLGDVVALIKG